MRPVAINGELWRVVRVPAGDPRLIDRTGVPRVATTSPSSREIAVLDSLVPPLLDRVVLHEVAHAITVSWALLPELRSAALRDDLTRLEEWSARLVENHAMEAVNAASEALGRKVCVRGVCMGHD